MKHPSRSRLKRLAPHAAVAAAILAGAAALALVSTAHGASERQLAASMEATQTCSARVAPGARIDIEVVVANTGDAAFDVTAIDADAATPTDATDDFVPTLRSGTSHILPGQSSTYGGSYTAPDEDATNIVGVDAVATGAVDLTDLAPCETDVIQSPEPGVRAGARVVSGKVLFKLPGTNKFVELTGQTEIPMGTQVDTLHGTISLTAGLGGGKTNSAEFYDGLFTIFQPRARNAFMTLRLDGGKFSLCRGTSLSALSIAGKSKKPVRKVWGSGKGRFTTRGRYSSATVRGTKWLTQDQCNGTYTRVLKGIVQVRDFRLRKTVNVKAGRSYLAKAPGA
jgi:hypothetical protein